LSYVCINKMKNFEKILLFLTILLVVFNLTQLNIYNFLGDENRIALICFILSLCALILILILMISKRIKNRYRN
jgi:L-lactate permease